MRVIKINLLRKIFDNEIIPSATVRYVLFSLLLTTIGLSCSNRNLKTEPIIIDLCSKESDKERIFFSHVFDSFKIIPLESNKDAVIETILDIIINDTLVYILDGIQTKSLYLYSINGDHLNTLSKKGRGPGEYINPVSFQIDKQKDILLLLDMNGQKINQYDPITFEFIRSIDTPQEKHFSEFIQIDDELYLYGDYSAASSDEYLIYKTDSQGKLIGKFLKYSDYHPSNHTIPRSINRRLSKNDYSAMVISPDNKSIFSIFNGDVSEYLIIKQNEVKFKSYSSNSHKELIQIENNKDQSFIIHDKKTQTSQCVRVSPTTDDITKFKFPRLIKIDGDWIAFIVHPVNVKYLRSFIEIDSIKLPTTEITNLLNRFKSYDDINEANPTIILYRLKQ